MRSFVVVTKILTGPKSIRCLVATTADGWFVLAHCKLVQRIEKVRSGQVAIQVVPGATRSHCMVQDVRWCIAIKCEQTRCIVVDGNIDYSHQRIRGPLVVTGFNKTG